MQIVDTRHGPLRYRLAFWPDPEQLRRLADGAGPATLVKVVQTTAVLPDHPRLIRRGRFRTQVIDLDRDPEAILADMGKTCRYEIRRVMKEEGRVRVARSEPAAMEDFFAMYNGFVRRSGHIRPLTRRRFREYAAASDVWVLYHDGRPACGRLVLRDPAVGRACMIFSPSRRHERDGDAGATARLSRYLLWAELQAYRSDGFRAYDLGGIGDGTSSIAWFKRSFGGVPVVENSYLLGGAVGRLADAAEKALTRTWQRTHARPPAARPPGAERMS